ncbi:MAG: aminotransferase class V-fold PLP-dependent enzyme [Lewinellaceae bacterium]|nr:aminotransferase class V-fold PLP-dependent enzyme [Saprospiraceae bacterium]MCB9343317.1 aminotransferase class V-fold PLP-dependent enzyme [Lewinellaceae bacterium]
MLENYFSRFRKNVIGIDQTFHSPYGQKTIIYADWTASGRLYLPIEKRLMEEIAPFVGNTHTETSVTGTTMTLAYHEALNTIKKHVGARPSDVIISSDSGMTGVVNKLQRMLGLKVHEKFADQVHLAEEDRPVLFCTHMEHHSNQTSWLETIVEVQVIQATDDGRVDLEHLKQLLKKFENRKRKIAAVTSCSNVTGISTPYYQIAEIMHQHGGLCFVDFAAAAPYININMRPENEMQHLDALYFSPHKFLGGPGTTGILVFDPSLYHNRIPDHPGGGTVDWTNPWGEHKYIDEIEAREDGGTPAFLQTMKVALCVKLKEEMGVENMLAREEELMHILWGGLKKISNLHLLAGNIDERLGIVSFYIENLHYNLIVRLLNDRFGIQARGGCSCAGTYGHFLLHVSPNQSKTITDRISLGDNSTKPGWVRVSIHPVMTDAEAHYIVDALTQIAAHHHDWSDDYVYNVKKNEFYHKSEDRSSVERVRDWFEKPLGVMEEAMV